MTHLARMISKPDCPISDEKRLTLERFAREPLLPKVNSVGVKPKTSIASLKYQNDFESLNHKS